MTFRNRCIAFARRRPLKDSNGSTADPPSADRVTRKPPFAESCRRAHGDDLHPRNQQRGTRCAQAVGRGVSQDRHVGPSHRIAVTHLSGNHGRPNAAASGGIRVLKEEAEKLQDLSNLPKSSYPQNVAQFLANKLPKSLTLSVNPWRSGRGSNVSLEAYQCAGMGGRAG